MKPHSFKVKARKEVKKQIALFPKAIKVKFFEFTELLEINPRPNRKGFRQLGKDQYRCWLGLHHRVEWMVDDGKALVIITDVGPRERM